MRFVEYENSFYPFSIDYVHISPMAAEVVVNNLIIPNIPILLRNSNFKITFNKPIYFKL